MGAGNFFGAEGIFGEEVGTLEAIGADTEEGVGGEDTARGFEVVEAKEEGEFAEVFADQAPEEDGKEGQGEESRAEEEGGFVRGGGQDAGWKARPPVSDAGWKARPPESDAGWKALPPA